MKQLHYQEEYIPIDGTEQYLLHLPGRAGAPVLLYLHGGPGVAESNFGLLYRRYWGDDVTVVHWDQRGAGKTYTRSGPTTASVGINTMLADMAAVVRHVKARYGTERILLLGHSWGTVLGCLYAAGHPQDVLAYIGVGQFVNAGQSNHYACRRLRDCIAGEGNVRDGARLKRIMQQMAGGQDAYETMKQLSGLLKKYKLSMSFTAPLALAFLKSPTFRYTDLAMFSVRMSRGGVQLFKQIVDVDLREEAPVFEMPVCFILGENDYQTATPLAQQYFDHLQAPKKALHIIPGAGHNTMFDQPQQFAAALHSALQMVQG